MTSKVKKDRLSRYFEDLNEFEISSGEDLDDVTAEPDSNQQIPANESRPKALNETSKVVTVAKKESVDHAKRLPSAHECLKTQSSPAFLRLNQQKEVDWDKSTKNLDQPENTPLNFETSAVPPPTSYEPVTLTDSGTKVDSKGDKRKRMG